MTDLEREQSEPFDFDLRVVVKKVKPHQARGSASENPPEPDPPLRVIQALHHYVGDKKYVLLVGQAGAGKTKTLLRYLLELVQQAKDNPSAKIPILVQLKDYKVPSDDYSGIVHLIRKDLGESWGLYLTLQEIQQYLFQERRFLLLVDGLNALSTSQESWKDISQFWDRCHKRQISIVFTTRGLGYRDLGIETQLEIQPIAPEDRQRFIEDRVSPGDQKKLQEWLNRARQSDYTPFVMWMLATVCQQVNSSSQLESFSIGEAFREFVRLYQDRLYEEGRISDENCEEWAFKLEHLASEMMSDKITENFVISRVIAIQIIGSEALLNNLVRHHLLVERRGKGEIEFCHQLLQEYYVAEWLRRKLPDFLKDENSSKRFQHDYLNYLKWTEPIAIMLGLPEITDNQAEKLIESALKVDLYLGARLAGEVKPNLQQRTINLVIYEYEKRKLPPLIKIICLQKSRSVVTIQSLIKALNEPGADIQAKALQALKEIAIARILPYLLQAIENPNGKNYLLIIDIIDLLVLLDTEKNTLPKLRELLKSEYPGIRQIAVWALARLNTKECISDLINALHDPTIRVRQAIINALGEIGYQEIIPYLLNILDSHEEEKDNGRMFSTAASALAKLDSDQALLHHHGLVRKAVISLLEKQNLEVALPRLAVALKDADCLVRAEAMRIIGKLKVKELIAEVLQGLEDSETGVQMQAAYAIGQICSVEIMPELLEKLKSENSETRNTIVDAMQNLDSEQAVPGLFQALADSDQSVRRNALYALGQLCRKNTIPHFIRIFLNPTSEDYNISINNYLHELEHQQKSDLLEQANCLNTDIRWEAVKKLAIVASQAAIPDLIKNFSRVDSTGNRWRIINDLRTTANKQILPTLLDALNDTEVSVRRHAAFGIRDLGNCLHLDYLWQQQSQNPLEAIDIAIAAIQSRCGFYNYEIYQQAQEAKNLGFEDDLIRTLYKDIDKVISQIQENPELRQEDSEDRLTIDIVKSLDLLGYNVSHETKIGGHADIVIRKNDFLWLGEAKIYGDNNNYLWEGFLQLTTRYSIGDDNQQNGGLLIYIRQEDASSIMKKWQNYLLEKSLPDYSFRLCQMRSLAFISTHKHERSGLLFHVRHIPVILHFAPKDKSGRRKTKSP
ncbi:MAG: HEAT repeat domain-containing protein [Microcoleus sp. PH2017_15_JOR_U_A]|uniref:HEAT repeat domain-containing protein n=1 Tax=unclassified Microcoleus TaxID=2642155 RepID=UPI001D60F6AD|nr:MULTISPECIES: HEAT repeat domain-containing protein [unclassified Microcoleus]MCC3472682.1 HEAT repeat domain-containing protein [Microcoleus sp. PH2017_13_LAR_U_A]MCC3485134.1 HEAT repeat domain-containing protein [Microcoleus sp. PH2017_14_LAR_D_A]MCC3497372.1 HEAT repeat domain-containing protein [Microcoleus sp. PH2017_15_JOR_U_A]MCC3597785.1 HEAT repeat domain-containing protein [Microcoleus sp. PH2017_26_ELK_O_A]MCC3622765.1 HEAT repeat domain-containing protein [Microcoleus sp. PH201